ncbi:MAG TPA: ABC transporter permease subunit [Conexivisphaerales archaeon]|nr:ABC transporter permease subunit [Conexivisphaerales archaeon]
MLSQAFAIARKDIREYLASKTLMVAVFILPVMMAITVPSLVGLFLGTVPSSLVLSDTRALPPVLSQAVQLFGPKGGIYWYLFNVVTLPLFLLMPTASVIVLASDSFAGEKERKTAEGLVAEPVSLQTIFVGKTLAPVSLAVLSTWLSAVIYWALVSTYSSLAGVRLVPDATWLSALVLVVPCLSLASVAVISWISSLSRGFKEAQQLAGVLMVPLVAMILSTATGNFASSLSFNVELSAAYLAAFAIGVYLWAKLIEPRKLVE